MKKKMPAAPILRHRAWPELLSELGARPGPLRNLLLAAGGASVSGLGASYAQVTLAPVAALARCISEAAPDLLRRPQLRILVLADDPQDVPDEGRWFNFLPAMLGYAGRLQVVVLFRSLEGGPNAFRYPPFNVWLQELPPAEIVCGSLPSYLVTGDQVDFAFVTEPSLLGIEGEGYWMRPGELPELLARGAVVAAVTHEWFDAAITTEVFEAGGLGRTRQIHNPFSYVIGDVFAQPLDAYSHCWSLSDPPALPHRDRERIARALRLADDYASVVGSGADNPGAGRRHEAPGTKGHVVIGGLAGRGVDVVNGDVYTIRETRGAQCRLTATGQRVDTLARHPVPRADAPRLVLLEWAEAVLSPRLFPQEVIAEIRQAFDSATPAEKAESKREFTRALSNLSHASFRDPDALVERFMARFGEDLSGVAAGIPLFVATDRNDAARVRELLAAGAAPDMVDEEGWTPLNHAASIGAVAAAVALMKGGATIDKRSPFEFTPLETALVRQKWAVALALLKGGASTDHETPRGNIARLLTHHMLPPELVTYLETEHRHGRPGVGGTGR